MVININRAILYGLGPFFAHPLKPLLSVVFGDGYERAYTHFRRDHSRADNLLLHCVCLVAQLVANFALLRALDGFVFSQFGDGSEVAFGAGAIGTGIAKLNMSTLTAACWAVCLVFSGAPALCSACSVACIAGALLLTSAETHNVWVQWVLANLQALSIATFLVVMFAVIGPSKAALKKAVFWGGFVLLWEGLARGAAGSVGSEHVAFVYGAMLVLLLAIPAVLTDPVVATVAAGAFLLNTFSVLCDGEQPVLRFWAMAYVAMGLQGAAHDVSSQPATLLNLQVDESGDQKTRFEWSHVTFFPDLLFHSCYQSLTQGPTTPRKTLREKK